jgi:hypothetical protein
MPEFALDSDEYMQVVMEDLDAFQPELLILDVLNVLHAAEENDNTAMRRVMRQVENMSQRLHCAIAILHHEKKGEKEYGSLKGRARGASAIGGWAQWVFALGITNPGDPQREWVRKVEFESKACAPHEPIEFMIDAPNAESICLLPVGSNVGRTQQYPSQISLQ